MLRAAAVCAPMEVHASLDPSWLPTMARSHEQISQCPVCSAFKNPLLRSSAVERTAAEGATFISMNCKFDRSRCATLSQMKLQSCQRTSRCCDCDLRASVAIAAAPKRKHHSTAEAATEILFSAAGQPALRSKWLRTSSSWSSSRTSRLRLSFSGDRWEQKKIKLVRDIKAW